MINPQPILTKKDSNNAINNENSELTTDPTDTCKIINTYFKNLYSNKMEDTEEMDRFLDTYELLKMNQEDMKILNKPVLVNETSDVIKTNKERPWT